jgi:hypothetical protein
MFNKRLCPDAPAQEDDGCENVGPLLHMMVTAFLLAAAQAPAPPAAEPEIVVTAMRDGRCRVRLARRLLSDGELRANAREWAALGTPVRVVRPAGAGHMCLARIAFRLNDQGVRLIHFVDAAPR